MSENAKANFMGPRVGNKESIIEAAAVFERLGLTSSVPSAIGVDAGEETATRGAASRPRIGVDLTGKFGLIANADSREWKTANNELALRSQVWGEWIPDADNHRHHRNEDGEILWAALDWLDQALPKFDMQLVYTVTLEKYKEGLRQNLLTLPNCVQWTLPFPCVRSWSSARSSSKGQGERNLPARWLRGKTLTRGFGGASRKEPGLRCAPSGRQGTM